VSKISFVSQKLKWAVFLFFSSQLGEREAFLFWNRRNEGLNVSPPPKISNRGRVSVN
jgi:hypothetical protein